MVLKYGLRRRIKRHSFDHLVGVSKQRGRHSEAEQLGGLEIDDQFEFGPRALRLLGFFPNRHRLLDSRPSQPRMPTSPCPLCPGSDRIALRQRNDATSQKRTHPTIMPSSVIVRPGDGSHRARWPVLARIFARLARWNAETELVGWRSSADDALLHPLSLLTGNFTGNFAKSRLRECHRPQIKSPLQDFRSEFATLSNREFGLHPGGEQGIFSFGIEIVAEKDSQRKWRFWR
jgi:hypothetical protein